MKFWGAWLNDNASPGIYVPQWVIRVTTSPIQAFVLAQLAYWFGQNSKGDCRASINREGHLWVAKSARELADEIGFSESQVERVTKELERRGLLATKKWKFNGAPTRHYRLGFETLERLVAELPPK